MDKPDESSSIVRVVGVQRRQRCGYCKRQGSSQLFGAVAQRLTCSDYQTLVDRGWRRSGDFLYLTDHGSSCCAHYPIRTHAHAFTPSKRDRKLMRRIARTFDAPQSEWPQQCEMRRSRMEIALEASAYSEAKFEVFAKYQRHVHGESATRDGFAEFLCESPLVRESRDGVALGSFHQCYYVDSRLVAVGVLDVLPAGVSSVYLFYDPEFARLSLGAFSALREIALVRELGGRCARVKYYYMGYYIPTCPKMRYKARWRPAELLDLVTRRWVPIERCLERIERHPIFVSFDECAPAGLARDDVGDRLGFMPAIDPDFLSDACVRRAMGAVFGVAVGGQLVRVEARVLAAISDELRTLVLRAYTSLGPELVESMQLFI